MTDYERLTRYMQVGNKVVQVIPQRKERIQAYIDRLFDLEDKIESGELCEQRTCKNMTDKNPVDEFICSNCGFHYEDISETREDEDGEYSYKVEFETKYCPNCGAKVEEEE